MRSRRLASLWTSVCSWLCLWFCALVSTPSSAAAGASRVVLLHAPTDDALIVQGNTLLEAELRTAGFEVTSVLRDPSRDIRSDIEAASAALAPIATFAIRPASDGAAVELWLEDRVTHKLLIRRIVVDRKHEAPADLAVRAVELLRGSLVEVILPPGSASGEPEAPRDVARWLSNTAAGRTPYFSTGFGIGAGGTALASAGLGTTLAPSLCVAWGTPRGLAARLWLATLGSSLELRRPEGRGEIHQDLLLLEGARVFRAGARFQPMVIGAAGIRRLRVRGMGTSTLFPDASGVAHALAVNAGGGLALRLGQRIAVLVETQLVLVAASTAISVATVQVGRAGELGWMSTVAAVASF